MMMMMFRYRQRWFEDQYFLLHHRHRRLFRVSLPQQCRQTWTRLAVTELVVKKKKRPWMLLLLLVLLLLLLLLVWEDDDEFWSFWFVIEDSE
jgi:hypothetical protein